MYQLHVANPGQDYDWLTTFFTFSAETVVLIQKGRLFWVLGSVSLHVLGSLAMTAAGLLSYQIFDTR